MALFNMGSSKDCPFTIFEVPGKIYIFGQGHDATSLTPIFGDFLRNRTGTLSSASPLFTAGSEMVALNGSHHLENTTDYEMTRFRKTSLGTSFPIELASSVAIGSGQYLSVNGGNRHLGSPTTITKYEADGTVVASSTVNVGNALIAYEDEINVYCIGRPMAAVMPSTSTASVMGITLFSVNKNSLSVAMIEQTVIQSRVSPGTMHTESIPVHKSSDGLLLLTYTTRNHGLLASTSGSLGIMNTLHATRITPGGVVEKSTTPLAVNTLVGMGGTAPTVFRFLRESSTELTFLTVAPNNSADLVSNNELQLLLIHVGKETLEVKSEKIGVILEPGIDYMSAVGFKSTEILTTFDIQELPHDVEGEKIFLMTQLGASSVKAIHQSNTFTVRMVTGDLPSSRVTQVFKHRPNLMATGFIRISKDFDQFFISYGDQGGDFLQVNSGTKSLIKKESVDFPISSCMVDQVGRFWAQDDSNGSIHLFSQTTTATLKVGFADKGIKFDGSVVNSNIIVSAYNHLGARVANNIVLNLEGSSATFADGSKSTTITTDVGGDTLVPIKIVGNGYIRVAANLAV